jgi:hypothetical protein
MLLHPDAISEQCPACHSAADIDGQHRHLLPMPPVGPDKFVDEGAFPGPGITGHSNDNLWSRIRRQKPQTLGAIRMPILQQCQEPRDGADIPGAHLPG